MTGIREANSFMSTFGKSVSVSIRSRNGAPSRKGCVVNGQMTKVCNRYTQRPPIHSINRDGREEEIIFGNRSLTKQANTLIAG